MYVCMLFDLMAFSNFLNQPTNTNEYEGLSSTLLRNPNDAETKMKNKSSLYFAPWLTNALYCLCEFVVHLHGLKWNYVIENTNLYL